jgi:hypothetical protein
VTTSQPQPDLTLIIVGFIWTGGDDFDITVKSDAPTGFTRLHIPEFVERVRKVALQRGMTMGDLCDQFNRELEAKQALEQPTTLAIKFKLDFADEALWDALNWKQVE